jgi:hypothetical protein
MPDRPARAALLRRLRTTLARRGRDGELDRWADTPAASIPRTACSVSPGCAFMYEAGFQGRCAGYSPANSLLHSVMSRRLGIPLTLSIVFMETGWRSACRSRAWASRALLAPDRRARRPAARPVRPRRVRAREDCRRTIELTSGAQPYDPSTIRSLGKRAMTARLLFNLKVACPKAGDDKARSRRWSGCCPCTGRPAGAARPQPSTAWTAIARRASLEAYLERVRTRSIVKSSSATYR